MRNGMKPKRCSFFVHMLDDDWLTIIRLLALRCARQRESSVCTEARREWRPLLPDTRYVLYHPASLPMLLPLPLHQHTGLDSRVHARTCVLKHCVCDFVAA